MTAKDHDDPFAQACREVFACHPDAIGVAYKGLDCGCSLLCGVDARGAPVGRMIHVGTRSRAGAPVCLACKRDNPWGRVVREGLVWPGSPAEHPEPEVRATIGRTVFGPDYSE